MRRTGLQKARKAGVPIQSTPLVRVLICFRNSHSLAMENLQSTLTLIRNTLWPLIVWFMIHLDKVSIPYPLIR